MKGLMIGLVLMVMVLPAHARHPSEWVLISSTWEGNTRTCIYGNWKTGEQRYIYQPTHQACRVYL